MRIWEKSWILTLINGGSSCSIVVRGFKVYTKFLISMINPKLFG